MKHVLVKALVCNESPEWQLGFVQGHEDLGKRVASSGKSVGLISFRLALTS